ncbi:MAG: lysophospholipid acyltransferase family protein [Chitinophagia bacterium]
MKNRLLYILLYGISRIPLRGLHLLSDVIAFVVYHWIGYRKQVVLSNLAIAFPEKTPGERIAIAKAFYRNFTDAMLESIKLISADDKLIDSMFVISPEFVKVFQGTDKNIQIHAMHNFNWEIVNLGISKAMPRTFLGVYQPIINPFFEELFRKIRTRNGTVLIPANDFKNNFLPHQDKSYALALVADQNPGHPAKAWWLNFFGKAAPFVMGPEKAARKRDTAVVFGYFYPLKRGVYTFSAEHVTDDLSSMQPGDLTKKYIRFVEEKVRERPDNYLWSHRRWKHPFKEEYSDNVLEKLNLS